jgi:3-hydroxybutyryl-CoA dehydratase
MVSLVEFDRLQMGDAAAIEFTVTNAEIRAFRKLSGDTNPIHDDPEYAHTCGYPRPIVYGALIVARVSRLLGTRLPGHGCVWQSLSMNFLCPLFVGEAARLVGTVLHANADLRIVIIGLSLYAGGRRVAEGRAQALFKGPL